MDGQDINIEALLDQALAYGNERANFEFKEVVDPDKGDGLASLVRSMAAMSNGDADGVVFIGVRDKPRDVVGLPQEIQDKFDQTEIIQRVSSYLSPPPSADIIRFDRQGKKLVAIVVHPFKQVPVFLSQGLNKYSAGTILIRTPGGATAPAVKESDIGELVDRIIRRNAARVATEARRYLGIEAVAQSAAGRAPSHDPVELVQRARSLVSRYWKPQNPYLEVFFAPCEPLDVGLQVFKQLFPGSEVQTRFNQFPLVLLPSWPGPELTPQGWIGRVPRHYECDKGEAEPSNYVWGFHTSWSFIDREHYWEDHGKSRIVGGIGIMHVITRICLMLRLLRRIGIRCGISRDARFRVGVRLMWVRGRYLASEYTQDTRYIQRSEADDIEVSRVVRLESLERRHSERVRVPGVALELMEEAGWNLGRTDLTVDVYERAIEYAADHVEASIRFPDNEDDVQVIRQAGDV